MKKQWIGMAVVLTIMTWGATARAVTPAPPYCNSIEKTLGDACWGSFSRCYNLTALQNGATLSPSQNCWDNGDDLWNCIVHSDQAMDAKAAANKCYPIVTECLSAAHTVCSCTSSSTATSANGTLLNATPSDSYGNAAKTPDSGSAPSDSAATGGCSLIRE